MMREVNLKNKYLITMLIVITTLVILFGYTKLGYESKCVTHESVLMMRDSQGKILPSRHIKYNGEEKYNLIVTYDNPDIVAYKIILLINGYQYDLNLEDKDSRYLEKNADRNGGFNAQIDFSNLSEGRHNGLFIIQREYTEIRETLNPELSSRFTIDYKKEPEKSASNPLVVNLDTSDEVITKRIDRIISFAVFHESGKESLIIKNKNIIKHNYGDPFYIYIDNTSSHEADFNILLISEGEVFSGKEGQLAVVTLPPDTAMTFRTTIDSFDIPLGEEFYFVAVPNPNAKFDSASSDENRKKGVNTFIEFSQKFICVMIRINDYTSEVRGTFILGIKRDKRAVFYLFKLQDNNYNANSYRRPNYL